MQDDASFIYKVEWAAVERQSEVSFDDKCLLYPELHIIFCLFEINSNDKQPA